MTPDLIIALVLGLLALTLVIGGPIWLFRRAARINAAQEAEARAFEQEILIASRRPAAQGGAANSGTASTPSVSRSTVGQAMPVYGETAAETAPPPPPAPADPGVAGEAPAAPTMPVPPEPVTSGGPPSPSPGAGPDGLSPFVRGVIQKLEVAGTFQTVEGPLRCANPELKGTLVSLKGGKRLGIIDAGFERDDAALQALLRHMDGLVVEGNEGEALVFKRFQDFLSEVIAF